MTQEDIVEALVNFWSEESPTGDLREYCPIKDRIALLDMAIASYQSVKELEEAKEVIFEDSYRFCRLLSDAWNPAVADRLVKALGDQIDACNTKEEAEAHIWNLDGIRARDWWQLGDCTQEAILARIEGRELCSR